eukprot:6184558-Pleurochrysis_carterae.AAC.1
MAKPSDQNFDAFLNEFEEGLKNANTHDSAPGTKSNNNGPQQKQNQDASTNANKPSKDPDPPPPLPVKISESAVCKQAYGRNELKRSKILLHLDRFHQNNNPRLYHKSTLAGVFVLTNPLKLHDRSSPLLKPVRAAWLFTILVGFLLQKVAAKTSTVLA